MDNLDHFLRTYFHQYMDLPPGAFSALRGIFRELQLGKNEILQPIGHTCRTIYIIRQGLARIYYLKEALDITEDFAFEGNLAVRFESLFTGKPSQKGIQVLEDTSLIAIRADDLNTLYDEFPVIERLFRKIFEHCHVDTIRRMERIQFCSAAERYRMLLEERPEAVQRISLKYIASYLGITQVSLSRIRSII